MTEQEWLASDNFLDLYNYARKSLPEEMVTRKWKLLTIAIFHDRFWHRLEDERSKLAVEVVEKYIEGEATTRDLSNARNIAYSAYANVKYPRDATYIAYAIVENFLHSAIVFSFGDLYLNCNLLRNIVNPFHKPLIPSEQARNLANVIYKSKDWQALTVLADLLEDEGCTNTTLLNHLRTKEQVYRGWWSLDVIRGF